MYTTKTKSYTIDLDLDEEDRWAEVIKSEKRAARRIAKEAIEQLPWYKKALKRTRDQATMRPFKPPVLVQANHHVARRFKSHNEAMDFIYDEDIDETQLEDSERRAATMERELKKVTSAKTLSQAAKPLRVPPVRNDCSVQQMAFVPKTGKLKVWRLV